ncbi:hypothetical protein LTR84_010998 [Exophiala bonariae]|uniref:Uncharacterized protein n=1 Tax=Exophiala bonariae TaxID=1690606 RepID=A0AAV9NIE6_9EURO|nr:hypothetical protein LTR84_010998 [Exophiala bonariae]
MEEIICNGTHNESPLHKLHIRFAGNWDNFRSAGPSTAQDPHKRVFYFGRANDDRMFEHQREAAGGISSGFGCLIREDVLQVMPKEIQARFPCDTQIAIRIPQKDGSEYLVHANEMARIAIYLPEKNPDAGGQPMMVEFDRLALVVPADTGLSNDGSNIKVWMGADYWDRRSGYSRALFRECQQESPDDQPLLDIIHPGGDTITI